LNSWAIRGDRVHELRVVDPGGVNEMWLTIGNSAHGNFKRPSLIAAHFGQGDLCSAAPSRRHRAACHPQAELSTAG